MSPAAEGQPEYDGIPSEVLRAQIGAPALLAVARCDSTMDLAHQRAAGGAEHGSVIVADAQDAGRGRTGKVWASAQGRGVWASVVVRPRGDAPWGLLSLRVGLALADALDAHVTTPLQLKWPNDVFLAGKKVAGVLTEARWRGGTLEWIVVGVGVNLSDPESVLAASALGPHVTRAAVLADVVGAVRVAAACDGELSVVELARFDRRDLAAGRSITAPLSGIVAGITAQGGLQVRTSAGMAVAVAGSLVFSTPSVGAT